jgi:hypothetical protein
VEFENLSQLTKNLRRQRLFRIEAVSLRLALHILSLVYLGVAVAAAKGLELA